MAYGLKVCSCHPLSLLILKCQYDNQRDVSSRKKERKEKEEALGGVIG